MSQCSVLVGVGQMGSVFAHALLRMGHTVVPVRRGENVPAELDPALVLVTVGEMELSGVLESLPSRHRGLVGLVQNELVPSVWERHSIVEPTVAVVWFEKKPSIATHEILPTPIAGPKARLLVEALVGIGIHAHEISARELPEALAVKNVYILTCNVGGLALGGGTVGALWSTRRARLEELARDAIRLQEALLGVPLDARVMLERLDAAICADPAHGALGRTGKQRLARALAQADERALELPAFARVRDAEASL